MSALTVAQELAARHHVEVSVTLTDKFPNLEAFKRAARESRRKVTVIERPVEATDVPGDLEGFWTMFTSFHHFKEPEARRILANAVRQRRGIGVFEYTERNFLVWGPTLLAMPLFIWLATPFIRPLSWRRVLWTNLLPVVPFLAVWDGLVSCLRTYSPAELLALTPDSGPGLQVGGWKAPVVRRLSHHLPARLAARRKQARRDDLIANERAKAERPLPQVVRRWERGCHTVLCGSTSMTRWTVRGTVTAEIAVRASRNGGRVGASRSRCTRHLPRSRARGAGGGPDHAHPRRDRLDGPSRRLRSRHRRVLVRGLEPHQREARGRWVAERLAVAQLLLGEPLHVVGEGGAQRVVVGMVGLDHDRSRPLPPPRPSGHLREHVKGALGAAKIRKAQEVVRVDHAGERDRGEVVALRDHLGADQHLARPGGETLERGEQLRRRAGGVAVENVHRRAGEELPHPRGDLLGARADVVEHLSRHSAGTPAGISRRKPQ